MESGGNPFWPHERSAFQTPQHPSRIASLGIKESMESSQVYSQLPNLSFSSKVVLSIQFYPSSMSPFGNTFSSLMHAALFEPPPGLVVSAPDVQAPNHASQQHIVVPVAPVHPTMPQPPTNSPSVVAPALGVRVSIASSTSLSNASSNTQKQKSSDIWSANEDKWISLNRGNLGRVGTGLSNPLCRRIYRYTMPEQLGQHEKDIHKRKANQACSGAESSCWEFYSQMEDLIGGTPKVNGLGDGFIGEDFVNPEVISLVEDEDMAAVEGEGGLPKAREGDVGVS
ncbi:hypothetical protein L7F22_023161, partial [Adiantum nelumboides]|nr:hypothetical protein [Adiantum nelumboides]